MSGMFTNLVRSYLMPIALMATTPVLNILVWMVCRYYNGSVLSFMENFSVERFESMWPTPDSTTVKIVLYYALFEALLMIYVPGETHKGPITPQGNQPTYKLNGVASYFISIITLLAGFYYGYIPLGLVYDQFGKILLFISVFAFVLCFFLYFKGIYFPSSSDSGSSGNFVWDFYWGTELHPQIFNFNLKQFCNCRLGMMGWNLILFCFAAKQYEINGFVANSMIASILIQQAYIFKFFLWEGGYFCSLDIMHDRFGYYICWGVLCWIAGVYTLVGQYLVDHPIVWDDTIYFAMVALGIFFVWANYDADAQRQRVRDTQGKCTVWMKAPKIIHAKYKTANGKEHNSLLLHSGWWGIARHAHYVTEIASSFMWTIPAGLTHFLPFFYVIYLTILLSDRSYRDDIRCRNKYGEYWRRYCEKVPYSIIPGVY